ncbi:unnamed protein product [Polarella glacialis]|uniref:Uncharacterized protein n=1 Tax=Polarella glacialis TaxID=89957 RepID=A0A813DQ88_POLGL|nr:unnamed protein product [Polarella glacialis]
MLLERKKAELATKAAAEEAAKAEVEAAAQAKAEAEAAVQVEATDVEVAAAGPEAPTPTPPADVEASPLPTPEEPAPFVQVQLEDLPQHVEKLEDAVFNLLVEEWRSLQGDFVHSLQQLFGWHRSHLVDFRSGLYGIKQRFVEFLQRTDNRQSLVDNFVQRFNAFTEEYPDMRKQDATKNELHQRSDELHERLRKEVENRQSEALVQLEAIKGSRWVESQTEVLAAQVQHAVQLEVRRYHSACQLLEDFYYSSMQLGLPEAREAPPRVDAFAEDEPPPEDPKAKKAPPPKPKKGAAEEPVVPEVSPEEKASLRLCNLPPADVAVVVGHWEFPYLKDLFVQAKKAVWKLQDFAPPKIDLPVKEDPAEKVDPKAKGKAKAKPKAKGKDKDVEVAPAPLMPLPPLFVDLQQAIVHERATFVHRLSMIHGWSERRLLEVASSSKSTFEHLQDWVALRRRKELDASAGLVDIIKEHIESEDFIKTKLNFQNGHLHRRPNVLLRAPIPEAIPPPVEGISPFRWTIDQLDGLLEVMGNAAAALSPSRRMLPTHVALSILQQLTSATESDRKPVKVPAVWRSCGINKLRSLVSLFEHPPSTGSVDIVEFLLHIGLLHSPLGWPSINALLEVRKALEAQAPRGCAWPDFYVTADQLAQTTLFADPTGLEESFAKKFKPVTWLHLRLFLFLFL